jgi:hypothetical protein
MLKKCFFSFFFLIAGVVLIAQNHQEKIPLETILLELEKTYEIKFSYHSNLIKGLQCSIFSSEKTLEEKLNNLSKQTYLDFSRIDERYFVIKEKEVTDDHLICGVLIDSKSKLPISFSSILIEGTTQGTVSDEQGNFSLHKLKSNQQLVFNTVGYKTRSLPVYTFFNNPCLTITLNEENIELNEVLISDYITQGISKKQNGAIQVSPSKLGILPGLIEPDVLLSLQLLPGIQSPNETASGLHIRGSSPDQNLVLFDGIKMFQSGHFFGFISSFNPYVTKNINLFRNGTRAKFGDRIGGVLDISSGDEVPEFEAGFGINLTHADAFIKTPLFKNKVGLVFSARRSITDIVETITYQKFKESVFQNTRILQGLNEDTNSLRDVKNDFYFKDYNLKVVADITEKDKVSLSNLYNRNQLEYASKNDKFRESIEDNIAYQNKGTRINWSQKTTKRLSQDFDFHTSQYEFDYLGKRDQTRNDPTNNRNQVFEVKNYIDDVGFKYDFSYNLSDSFEISGGYQFSKTEVFYLFKNSINSQVNKLLGDENSLNKTNALFAEIKVNNNSKTFLSLGLRTNNFSSVDKWFFEPRIYASTQISDYLTLKTSGEIKNQAVSQIIEYRNIDTGLENNIWAVANKLIPILNSQQLSVGFLYQNNGWNLDVDVYMKKIKGLTLMTGDIANQTPLYVSGESNITGVDVLFKKRFGNYRSWISYSFSNTKQQFKDLNKGDEFNGINEIPHSLNWSHTYSVNQFEFSLGWKIRSGIPYTHASGTYVDNNSNLRILYEDVNGKRLPNYQKLDFSSTYKFNFSKNNNVEGKIGISLLNVFDTKNILSRTYQLKFLNNQGNIEVQKLVETDKISLGFTPNIVFRVSF